MSNLDRRDLLRITLGGLASGSLLSSFNPLHAMTRAAGSRGAAISNEKVLFIFMRGGLDGMLALVPNGDPYYHSLRNVGGLIAPYLPPSRQIPLTSFAGLNDRMGWLTNGPTSPHSLGKLALIHQMGNATGQRSHFTEMARLETASLLDAAALPEDGFVPRLSTALGLPSATAVGTASISTAMQRMFQSATNPQLHLRDVAHFQTRQFDAALVSHLAGTPAGIQEAKVDALGDLMLAAQQEIATPPLTHTGLLPQLFPYQSSDPWPLAIPIAERDQHAGFFKALEGAMFLLANTSCRVAGVEIGRFDTHTDTLPLLDNLLEAVAFGMRSVWDFAATFPGLHLTTVALSEFGRTAQANGNGGTDHGLGGIMLAHGNRVIGGVYNCDLTTWTRLSNQIALPQTAAGYNAVPVRTHWLAIQQEMIAKLFGVTAFASQSIILPGLPSIAGTRPATQLGFLT